METHNETYRANNENIPIAVKSMEAKHTSAWEHLLAQMIEGTRQAIADASLQKTHHTLTNGTLEKTAPGGSRYRFQLTDEWEPRANASLQIELDPDGPERAIAGTVLAVQNASIIVVTEQPLPQALLSQVTCYESTIWLLQRLLQALLRLQEQGEPPSQLGVKTFGLLPCAEETGKRQAQITTFAPDADQERAITMGMASERLLLLGPPGTGKTATESALALEYLLAGKTVLLVAHTNVALDTAMSRVKDFCEHSGNAHLLQEHQIVRLGKATELTGEAYDTMALSRIVDQRLGALAQQRDYLRQEQSDTELAVTFLAHEVAQHQVQWMQQREELEERLATLQQERTPIAAREQQRLDTIAARLATLAAAQPEARKQLDDAKKTLQQTQAALLTTIEIRKAWEQIWQAAERTLTDFRHSSFTHRLLARLAGTTEQTLIDETERCRRELAAAKKAVTMQEQRQQTTVLRVSQAATQVFALQQEAQQLEREQAWVTEDARQLQELDTQVAQVEQALQDGDEDMTQHEQQYQAKQRDVEHLAAQVHLIEEQERTVASQIVAQARLIGTTLTGLTTIPSLRDRFFDATMIDEASMAPLAVVLVAAAHATQHVALFGDPTQLAPVLHLHEPKKAPLAAYWLGTDLFSHLQITFEDADHRRKQAVLLSQQSRMRPEIAAPVSHFIYGGRLTNRIDPHRQSLALDPHPEWPLLLMDTSDAESTVYRTRRPPRSSSKYNFYHVQCVVQLVCMLLAQLPQGEEPLLGVVTPYSAQSTRIRAALQEQHLLHRVHVGTVHSFQSVEYPCIIFDTVEGPGVPIGQFMSNTWGRRGIPHPATRLINVAHSRARDKLMYVANVNYIRQDAYRKEHVLTKFVNYVEQQGHMDSSLLFERETASFL